MAKLETLTDRRSDEAISVQRWSNLPTIISYHQLSSDNVR
jgi:hypothetical protein